jgi:DNA-binding beta-propeller fold protein YncE
MTMINNKTFAPLIAIAACMAGLFAFSGIDAKEAPPPKPGAKIIDKITGLPPALYSSALNSRTNIIYLTGYDWNAGIGHLLVMDGWTHKVINQISSPTLNANLFVDEDTNTVWAVSSIAGTSNGAAIQFSGKTLQVLKTIPLNNVDVNQVAFNKSTKKYYVTNYNNGEIEVYDKQFNHLATVPDDNAGYIAVNEKTNKIYAANYWDGTVSVIDGSTNKIIGNPIQAGVAITPNDCYTTSPWPYPDCTNYDSFSALDGIAVDAKTNRIFVVGPNDGTLATIDGNTNKVISTLHLAEGEFFATTIPELKIALALNWDRSTLSILDEKTEQVTDTVQVGTPDSPNCLRIQWDGGTCSFWGDVASGVTVSADNKKIYVVDAGDGSGNSPSTDPYAASKLIILTPTSTEEHNH